MSVCLFMCLLRDFGLTERSAGHPRSSGGRRSAGWTVGPASPPGRWTRGPAAGCSHPDPRAPGGAPKKHQK